MKTGATLSRYLAMRYLAVFGVMLAALLGIALLFDVIELLRRAADRPEAGLALVSTMAILKLPEVGQQLVQFAILFSGLSVFWQLTRSQELVVARAAGISVWQFLLPVVLAAFALGLFKITVVNPIASILLARYETLEQRFLEGRRSAIDLSSSGLWLRQIDRDVETIIHARNVNPATWQLNGVLVLRFDADAGLIGRIDAPRAQLEDGAWRIRDAVDISTGQPLPRPNVSIPTEITGEEIESSFSEPTTLSFWVLPRFIRTLESTGFSANRVKLHFQSLLAEPLLYAALIVLAAAIAMRPPRQARAMMVVSAGLAVGFGLFFVGDMVEALALSGTLPVILAAWAPVLAAMLAGLAFLLYLEEG